MVRRCSLLVAVLMTVLVGCGSNSIGGTEIPVPTFENGTQPTSSVSVPQPTVSLPTRISIPEIDSSSDLIYTGLNPDGTLETPSVHEPQQASWYSLSPRPGAQGVVGPAVILGHVDGDGMLGVFYELHTLTSGSKVKIETETGQTLTYEVYSVEQFDKDSFPTERIYSDTPTPELRLITCGGAFDNSENSYEDNIVAFAKLME